MSRRTRVTRSNDTQGHASATITHRIRWRERNRKREGDRERERACERTTTMTTTTRTMATGGGGDPRVCLRGVVSRCSVVAAGRGDCPSSDGAGSDSSGGVGPGSIQGPWHHPPALNDRLNPGPTTPEASGGQPPPQPARSEPATIALWSSSLSACTNKACIRSVRVCKGLKRNCGAVEMGKNDFKGRLRGCRAEEGEMEIYENPGGARCFRCWCRWWWRWRFKRTSVEGVGSLSTVEPERSVGTRGIN